MKRKIRIGKRDGESEGFVWVTFTDLMTTLFMVFIVIALWAISMKDVFAKQAEDNKKAGEKCLADQGEENREIEKTKQALHDLGKKITVQFAELQKTGKCVDAKIEEVDGTGGFRIFQGEGQKPWFNDGKSTLSRDAQLCLLGIGDVWIEQINSSPNISSSLKNILIEGHANSNPFPSLSDEENFLRNLGLSQDRAYQATRFLIENITSRVTKKNQKLQLRELMIAQGKSYLEIVKNSSGHEDFERSKRLEFKVVLGGKGGP